MRKNLDCSRCCQYMFCPCWVRNKFSINFWNCTILLCMVCIPRLGRLDEAPSRSGRCGRNTILESYRDSNSHRLSRPVGQSVSIPTELFSKSPLCSLGTQQHPSWFLLDMCWVRLWFTALTIASFIFVVSSPIEEYVRIVNVPWIFGFLFRNLRRLGLYVWLWWLMAWVYWDFLFVFWWLWLESIFTVLFTIPLFIFPE
jgi:hypothetical protein